MINQSISFIVDGPSLKKSKHIEGPSLLMYNFKSKSFNSLVKLSKIHEGPVEASGYKVCTLGKITKVSSNSN
jgi:hypothetical protein